MHGDDDRYQLDHVAFGVSDVADVPPFLVGVLGGRAYAAGPGVEFRWWQWQFARGGMLEALQPEGAPGGFVHRFLKSRGPGVHHVTFKVPDLARAADRARSLGYEIVGYDDRSPYWKECFLHPKQAQGIVVQLAQAIPNEAEFDRALFPFPDSPVPAATPVDVIGVKLRAHDEAAARRQWQTLLGGEADSTGPVLRFRWPDSPLGVAVEIDRGGPEGPIAVELAAARGRAIPTGPHPVLGVAFTTVDGEA